MATAKKKSGKKAAKKGSAKPTKPVVIKGRPTRGKRKNYSDDEREWALAAVVANGGNVVATARQLSIPERTLRAWNDGFRHPEAAQLCEEKKGDLAATMFCWAWEALAVVPAKFRDAPLNHVMTSLGILIDKARLLRGEHTSFGKQESRSVAATVNVGALSPQDRDKFYELWEKMTHGTGGTDGGSSGRGEPGDTQGPVSYPSAGVLA